MKNSKDLLTNLDHLLLQNVSSIKTFDFSTLYTTIPHSKLKERLLSLVMRAFFTKKDKRRYKYIVVNYMGAYFVKYTTKAPRKYSEDDVIRMIEFLIDNIFVDGNKDLVKSFNFTFRYIDDVLSLNNRYFIDHVDRIYPVELEIKDTTDSSTSAAYLDLYLQRNLHGQLTTKLYDKRDDFNFPIVNFPFLDSNPPASPTYGVFMSQLIRYSRACSHYHDFRDRCRQLTSKLTSQGFESCRLMKTLGKFYGRHHDLISKYSISLCDMRSDMFHPC